MSAKVEETGMRTSGKTGNTNDKVGVKAYRAPWIAVLGVDGVGKTTVLRRLRERSSELPIKDVLVLHRRPRLVYDNPQTSGATIDHYGKANHGLVKSIIKLAAMVLDWHVGYWGKLRSQIKAGYLVVADRHSLLDILADPQRYRYGGPKALVRLAVLCVPMPEIIFVLDAPEVVLEARKAELSHERLKHLRANYLSLLDRQAGWIRLDANRPVDDVVTDIVGLLCQRTNG